MKIGLLAYLSQTLTLFSHQRSAVAVQAVTNLAVLLHFDSIQVLFWHCVVALAALHSFVLAQFQARVKLGS